MRFSQKLFVAPITGLVVLGLMVGPVSAKKDNNNGKKPTDVVQQPTLNETVSCTVAPNGKVTSGNPTFIVRFKSSTTDADIRNSFGANGKKFDNGKMGRLGVVSFPGRGRSAARATLESLNDIIESCEEDQAIDVAPLSVAAVAAVQSPVSSWGLDRIDQRNATLDNSYSYATTGSGVDIYVVDTGVLSSHNEFAGRIRAGFDATGLNSTEDGNGHGTHVAGTIAGSTYGVAPAATIVPVRVLKADGSGTLSGVIAGIDWAIADHVKTPSVPKVMNLSLGGGTSLAMNEAVTRATQAGITVVVAAGNSGTTSSPDACSYSPAGADNNDPTKPHVVITVGSTTATDSRSSFSNVGDCVDIFAPGSAITSAWYTSSTATQTISGTSMASPHVAGAAARILSANPTFTPAQVASVVKNDATPNVVVDARSKNNLLLFTNPDATSVVPPVVGEPSGDAGNEIAPSSPVDVNAVAGNRSAFVRWRDSNSGSSAITGHAIRVYLGTRLIKEVAGTASTSTTVDGLKAGRSYTFRVAAINNAGRSAFSEASNIVIPIRIIGNKQPATQAQSAPTSAPGKARNIRVRARGNRLVTTWRYASKDVGVNTSFVVLIRNSKGLVARLSVSDWQGVTIAGLKPGSYSVRVRAFNSVGSAKATKAVTTRIN